MDDYKRKMLEEEFGQDGKDGNKTLYTYLALIGVLSLIVAIIILNAIRMRGH